MALAGCLSPSGLDLPITDKVFEQKFAAEPDRGVDLLFVVDDSDGMAEEQAALVAGFPSLMRAMGTADLRVGVISSDLGAPGSRLAECDRGDRGALQAAPRGNCRAPSGRFLISLDAGTRTNFEGDLADAFACIAPLGTGGCGFEQHLASARRALDQDQPIENDGFLRPQALLTLVVLADEDDCSAPEGSEIYEPATSRFGPQRSFRCNEFGHLCGGGPPPRSPGAVLGPCQPAEQAGALVPIADYVRFFRSLKERADRVMAAVIAGPPTPYAVAGQAQIAPSCQGPAGRSAAPAVRLKAFADALGGQFASVCDGDLAPAMGQIGEAIRRQLSTSCLSAHPIPLVGTVPDCDVVERLGAFGRPTHIPACDGSALRPCWRTVKNQRCAGSSTELQIERREPAQPGAIDTLRCRTCANPNDARCH